MRRWKIIIAGLGLVLLLLGGGLLALRASFGPQHFDVTSIATLPPYQNAALLAEAWALPVAKTYPRPLVSQDNPTTCGPAALANVQRSLGATAASIAEAADAVGCTLGLCLGGRTLDELARGAELLTRKKVLVLRDLTLFQFRDELRLSNGPPFRHVINFQRGQLFGDGGGHHSPIGGYLEDRDLVLVLDVNAQSGAYLVPAERLFLAMDSVDPSTGKKRGLLRLQ